MARPGPLFNLPGPAALRGHAEKRRAPYLLIESKVPPRSLAAHAGGEYAPSGVTMLAYKVLLGIPLHAWFSAADLAAVGIGVDGKKLSKDGRA